ncbi:MAG: MBL fold metallo-hydrolase [Victivallaceae bacterium]|nr:MBL fold metallo-hydrolase [Victivallaceae bacterium]
MRLQILGSAAAEAVPALWCDCECCTYARKHGGKDLRRRCAYWVDGDTLVDFGPDAFWQSVEFGIDLTAVKRILFTHSHEDHLNLVDLEWRTPGFSHVSNTLKLFAPDGVYKRLSKWLSELGMSIDRLSVDPVTLDDSGCAVADGDLEIVPVPAAHMPNELCLNYILKRGGRSVLIANDTGWWTDASWELAAKHHLDAAVIECTMAFFKNDLDWDTGHMGVHASLRFRDKLVEIGALDKGARAVVNHFSHNGMPFQAKLEEYFAGTGIEVGYDGMVLDI